MKLPHICFILFFSEGWLHKQILGFEVLGIRHDENKQHEYIDACVCMHASDTVDVFCLRSTYNFVAEPFECHILIA